MPQPSSARAEQAHELIALLGELRDCVESVAHLERLKTHAIAARDLQDLADITRREEEATTTVRELEQQRATLLERWFGHQHVEPTIAQLAEAFGGYEAQALHQAGQELRREIDNLRSLTGHNANLLTWAADLAKNTAQWLLGYGQVAPAYNRSGDREAESALSARIWNA